MAKFHRHIALLAVSLGLAGCLVPIGDAADDDGSGGSSASGGSAADAGSSGSAGSAGATGGTSGAGASAGSAGSAGSGANSGRGCPLPSAPASGDAELPAPFFDLAMPVASGKTHSVAAGDDLQAVLDQVAPGDEIVLEAGAKFVGNFVLRNLGGDGWVIVRSSASDALPETVRVTPAAASELATLSSPNDKPVLTTNPGAHHVRFVGVRFTSEPGKVASALVTLGSSSATSVAEQPHHMVFDRCIFQGDPQLGAWLGISLNAANAAVIDSYFADFKSGTHDSEALRIINGPGPLALINNHIEGAWYSLRLGGDSPSIPDLVPSDIAICHNHITKPLSWKKDDPSFAGVDQRIAYLVSIESARRVLLSANVLDQAWDEDGFGTAVAIEPGSHAWATADDITFAFNVIKDVGSVFWIDSNTGALPTQIGRLRLVENLVHHIGVGAFTGVSRLATFNGPLDGLTVSDNTVLVQNAILYFSGVVGSVTLRDNLFGPSTYGLFGQGSLMGTPTLETHTKTFSVDYNVFVGESESNYPAGNFYPETLPEVGFANPSSDDYHLIASSPYVQAASDGGAIGADIDRIIELTSGVAP